MSKLKQELEMRRNLSTVASVFAMALGIASIVAFPAQAAGARAGIRVYSVIGVEAGKTLNLRSAPGVKNPVVAKIPANGQGVVATGEEKVIGKTTWAKVYWSKQSGWISKTYLTENPQNALSKPAKPGVEDNKHMMQCSGTEPFWKVDISETQIKVNMPDGPQYTVPVSFRQTSANNRTIAVISGNVGGMRSTEAFLQKVDSCSDGMSDIRYPYTITAVLNNQKVVSGCCKVK